MKKPSVLLIPDGYATNKLFSVLPTNGDGDFTFTRTSEGSRIDKDGNIDNVDTGLPRLSYDLIDGEAVSCPSLLLEPQRTNLVTDSNDTSLWTNNDITPESNATISPDGTLNASKLVVDTGIANANSRPMSAAAITTGEDYVFSIFVKSGGFSAINLDLSDSGFGTTSATYDVESGTVTAFSSLNVSQGIEYYGNGWYRCYMVVTAISTGTTGLILRFDDNGAGNGVDGLYFYGAEFSQGSFLTSYIPTEGSAVTRIVDQLECNSLTDHVSSSKGVIYFEVSSFEEVPVYNGYIALRRDGDAIFSNAITFQYRDNGTFRVYVNGTANANIIYKISPSSMKPAENNKIALKYEQDAYRLYINGVEQDKNLTPDEDVFTGLDSIAFDRNGYFPFNGRVRGLKIYKETLTSSEMEELTSWTSFSSLANGTLYSIK